MIIIRWIVMSLFYYFICSSEMNHIFSGRRNWTLVRTNIFMFTPSFQVIFNDPVANLEIPVYNRYILSLFVIILRRLFSFLACSNPTIRESIIDIQLLFAERGIFLATCILVIALCIPRLVVLYTQRPDTSIRYNLPVTAFQWYWNIRWERKETELYMEQSENLKKRLPYLLETSDCRVIPYGLNTTFFVTSNDVLHAFSLPNAFVKCDAVPRRLNALTVRINHPRVFFRQCSELCRVRHSYIPIKLEVINIRSAN